MTSAHKLMLQDGAPDALFLTPADRTATWAGRLLTVSAPFVPRRDDSVEAQAMREQLRQEEKTALLNRLARSKARKETIKIDHSRMRWDPRRCKFVEDRVRVAPTPESAPIVKAPVRDSAVKRGGETTPVGAECDGGSRLTWERGVRTTFPPATAQRIINRQASAEAGWSRVRPDTARTLAELNGVWKDNYAKLSGGLLVMTITNRLKGLVKQGGEIKWTR